MRYAKSSRGGRHPATSHQKLLRLHCGGFGPASEGWLYLPDQWKTEHESAERRIMRVSVRAKQLIDEAIIARRTDGHQMLLTAFEEFDPAQRLFTWSADHPYHAVSSFYKAVQRNLKSAGLTGDGFSNLQIRHAFATRAAAINVEGTRVQLGHRNLNTTMKYLDADGPAVRNLFDQLEHSGGNGGPSGGGPGGGSSRSGGGGASGGGRTGTDDAAPPFQLRLVGG